MYYEVKIIILFIEKSIITQLYTIEIVVFFLLSVLRNIEIVDSS